MIDVTEKEQDAILTDFLGKILANACKRASDRQREIELLQAENRELKLVIAKLSDRAETDREESWSVDNSWTNRNNRSL